MFSLAARTYSDEEEVLMTEDGDPNGEATRGDEPPSHLIERARRLIRGSDPRFGGLIPPEHTLESALAAGAVNLDQIRDAVSRVIELRTVEDQMSDLVAAAYLRAFKKPLIEPWRQALEARFGVNGIPATLDAAGAIAGVTRERVRQITSKITPLLSGAWVPALEAAAQLLVEGSPVAPPIGAFLSEKGLTRTTMTGEAFLMMVEIVGLDLREITGTTLLIDDSWVVDERERSVTGALKVASRHTSAFGMTTVDEIRQELSTEDFDADIQDILRLLRSNLAVKWAGEWLWVEKERDSTYSNSLINTMRNILSVNSPLTAECIHEGVARYYKFRGRDVVPPTPAILEFSKASPYFMVEDGLISPIEQLNYHEVLGPVAASVVDVFKASPYGVMDRASFHGACDDAGIARGTYSVWTTYAEYIEKFGRNVWGLRGTRVSPSVVSEIQNSARARSRAEPHRREWAWMSDGRIQLTMDVDTSSYNSCVWSFDSALRDTLGPRRFQARVGDASAGEIALGDQHNWVWGWLPGMRLLAAQPGDVMRAVLNLTAGTAEITKGGRELWDVATR